MEFLVKWSPEHNKGQERKRLLRVVCSVYFSRGKKEDEERNIIFLVGVWLARAIRDVHERKEKGRPIDSLFFYVHR